MSHAALSLALLVVCLLLSYLGHDIVRLLWSPNFRRDFRLDVENLRRQRREALDIKPKIPADVNVKGKIPAEWVSQPAVLFILVGFFLFVSLVLVFSKATAGRL
jgi:ABC-type Na+ efflux pump permease subunit